MEFHLKLKGSFQTILISFLFLTSTIYAQNERWEFSHQQMGTVFRIVTYSQDESLARKAVKLAFARLDSLNDILSDYYPESEVNRLCNFAGQDTSIQVSDDLWEVLKLSRKFSVFTDGAFDVSVGPLSRLWRRARRKGAFGPEEELNAALQAVAYEAIHMDSSRQSVHLNKKDMKLDFGGIAKGYAIDEMLKILYKKGLKRSLVDGGGDIVVGLPPQDSTSWRIVLPVSVRNPDAGSYVLFLKEQAVASSGDAYRYVTIDGTRYSHILNPKTGLGITSGVAVTVVSKTGVEADALASAVSVMGWKKGFSALNAYFKQTESLVVNDSDGKYQEFYTPHFSNYFLKP